MPTLYVENIPDELYSSIKERARLNRSSIAAEVLTVLEENFPTQEELARRRAFFERARLKVASASAGNRAYPATEDLQREDRER